MGRNLSCGVGMSWDGEERLCGDTSPHMGWHIGRIPGAVGKGQVARRAMSSPLYGNFVWGKGLGPVSLDFVCMFVCVCSIT